jgi:hypothetical protein
MRNTLTWGHSIFVITSRFLITIFIYHNKTCGKYTQVTKEINIQINKQTQKISIEILSYESVNKCLL